MAELLKITVLAVIQGVAEFLPISSSGHLAVFSKLFNINDDAVVVAVVLHAGTLLAILVYYLQELLALLKPENRRMILLLFIGTVPTALIGVLLEKSGIASFAFRTVGIAGLCFIVTAIMLFYSESREKGQEEGAPMNKLSYWQALLIGCIQGIAIFPGISRSGSTIATGLKLGMKKNDAATFSFLLAIPAIAGAVGFKLLTAISKHQLSFKTDNLVELISGFFISAIIGYFSLRLLIKILKQGKLRYFAYYCFGIGIIVLGWQGFILLTR